MIKKTALISLLILTKTLSANAGNLSYSAELTLLSDSAVTIEAADIGTNLEANSDSATAFMFGTEYQLNKKISVSYEFYHEGYQDLSENDTQHHSLSASYDKNIGPLDFFLNTSHMDMSLDGNDFLVMDLIIPSLSYYFDSGIYLNLSHTWIDKSFEQFNDFDAVNNATGITAYYFFADSKAYASLNYTQGEESANSDNNDYDEDTTTVSFQYPIKVSDFTSKLNISYSVRQRDYDKVADIVNIKSREKRERFKVYFDTEINNNWALRTTYDFKDRDSNLTASTYKSHYFGFRVTYNN